MREYEIIINGFKYFKKATKVHTAVTRAVKDYVKERPKICSTIDHWGMEINVRRRK